MIAVGVEVVQDSGEMITYGRIILRFIFCSKQIESKLFNRGSRLLHIIRFP